MTSTLIDFYIKAMDNSSSLLSPFTSDMVAEAVAAEALCFSGEAWSDADFNLFLSERSVAFAICIDGKLCAYGGAFDSGEEADLLNMVTLPDFRRRGYAATVLSAIINTLKERNCKTLTLEVRASNVAAITLYTSFGFKTVGIIKRYYSFPTEDALLMSLAL